jgi:protein-S-isoprenylcysteine O-methyltransferase Ste14
VEASVHQGLLMGWLALSVPICILLFFISAPYGRHFRGGWGLSVSSMTGWLLMELPAATVFPVCLLSGGWPGPVELVFLLLWQTHYVNRAIVYPLRQRSNKRVSLVIVSFGVIFNVMNGYLNGRHLGVFSSGYDVSWLWDPRFVTGAVIFATGFVINVHSDEILLRMRRRKPGEYSIPRGGMFEVVSCPNYLGEILEWTGWAIATWSLPGLAFALWTAANLIPRAHTNHAWYRKTYPDYPGRRKALIPFIY